MSHTATLSHKQALTKLIGQCLFTRQSHSVQRAQLCAATFSHDKVARQNRRCDIGLKTHKTKPVEISRQIFMGEIYFLTPNQQCQTIKGNKGLIPAREWPGFILSSSATRFLREGQLLLLLSVKCNFDRLYSHFSFCLCVCVCPPIGCRTITSAILYQFSPNFACRSEMWLFRTLMFLGQTGSRLPILEMCKIQFWQFRDCGGHIFSRIITKT